MQTTKIVLTGLAALAIAGTAKASLYGNPLVERGYASDYPAEAGLPPGVFVAPPVSLPNGTLTSFETWDQVNPGGSPFPSAGNSSDGYNSFTAYVLQPTVTPNQFTVVFESGLLTVPIVASSQVANFPVTPFQTKAGDEIAFYGQGVPVDITGSGNLELYYPSPAAPALDQIITLGSSGFPQYPQDRLYSFAADVTPVPEPTTVIAGVLLLLPFGASTLRILRKRQVA